jgi:hypothetical protein
MIKHKRSAPAFVAILSMAWMPFVNAGDRDTSTPQKLQELEKAIAVLRSDNATLREQLASCAAEKSTPTAAAHHAPEVRSPNAPQALQSDPAQAYWISGTGKRHNRKCRYFGTGKGHACGPNEGVACKICGG